ncbi:MAG: hypothetical protein ACLUIQ_06390 [Dialister invisus]
METGRLLWRYRKQAVRFRQFGR